MKASRVITHLLQKPLSGSTPAPVIQTAVARFCHQPKSSSQSLTCKVPGGIWRRLSTSSIACQDGKNETGETDADPKELPQLEVPQYNEDLRFRGLETDFPCLSRLPSSGPEAQYENITTGYKVYHHSTPFPVKYNDGLLPELNVAYETLGVLNPDKSNAVIIFGGLSPSSHIRSHKDNKSPGWWEKFVGPGCAVDTDKFFVICCNNLGSCYGTTGPSSINPTTGKPYGTTFPMITIDDVVRSQFLVLDHLGIDKLYAAVGASLGGMSSLSAAALFPDRVGRVVSISSCAKTHTSSIALRYLQRRAIMTDPNWERGHYYGVSYPRMGMKLAREIATITYRSGPEWNERFGRKVVNDDTSPSLCPYFMIEEYIEYQGESFSTKYDPNSILYLSKAVDFYDMGEGFSSLEEGISRVKCPIMIIGVQTDMLIPCWQQKEIADLLKKTGNEAVTYYELDSLYGHDTFMLDLSNVGSAIKGHLETRLPENGLVRKSKPKWFSKETKQSESS